MPLVKNPPENAEDTGDMGSVPGLGRSPGVGNGNHSSILAWRILQKENFSCLKIHVSGEC